ncbi:MAG: hypothetical protein HYR97_07855 [Candidatus Melainabacteria bacterium]|nr:hypothetical protein [Candidatus Melainabacteria bacterium]MBI3309621.1 hypothetical protein [Candidatus Melainabacteria bacterium]
MNKRTKDNLLKSFISLILVLIFILPSIAQQGIQCINGNITCPVNTTAVCTNGREGIAECRFLPGEGYVPGCRARISFYPEDATCVSSTSSSGGNSSSSSSSSSSGGSSTSSSSSSGSSIQCTSGSVSCPLNASAICINGRSGIAECRFLPGEGYVPGCKAGTSFYPEDAGCVSSTSSNGGSSSSSSSSSSSGGFSSSGSSGSSSGSLPHCSSGQIQCNFGTPACSSGLVPICGSELGLTGIFSGQGCTDIGRRFFNEGSAFCNTSPSSRIVLTIDSCDQEELCPVHRKRFEPCREDKTQCKCICSFEIKSQKRTPSCQENQAICSRKFKPTCLNSENEPLCEGGKLVCRNLRDGFIDLSDKVYCLRKK